MEHQGCESPSMVVHEVIVSPPKMKGKTHSTEDTGPDTVAQLDRGKDVDKFRSYCYPVEGPEVEPEVASETAVNYNVKMRSRWQRTVVT